MIGVPEGRRLRSRSSPDSAWPMPGTVATFQILFRSVKNSCTMPPRKELGARLRTSGEVCRWISLTVRYAGRTSSTRGRAVSEPTAHSPSLTTFSYSLSAALGLERARVRHISLRADQLARTRARTTTSCCLTTATTRPITWMLSPTMPDPGFGPHAIQPAATAPPPC
ncbi:hypothetical protein [Streptomyces sp. NPDC048425]|uniref:DinB/UmuC family translesion DNA polymerase n=1 Tax=Streptomyces sp. NPDC048425 TaxID=3365548 RepID=UPI003714FE1A